MKMVVGDLSSIEFGVVGWLARCENILNVLRAKKDAYIDFATHLYHRENWTYEYLKEQYDLCQRTKGKEGRDDFRQNAKPPVLGCGFGLGGGKMYVNGFGDEVRGGLWGYALNVCGVDMPKELAHEAVKIYRKINHEVPVLWNDLERGFRQVLWDGGSVSVGKETWNREARDWVKAATMPNTTGAIVTFTRKKSKNLGNIMRMQLPSGRYLHYLNARTREETVEGNDGKPWVRHQILYDGIEHSATTDAEGKTSKKGGAKWGETKTYGGKITENAIQAIARDILVNGAHLATGMGFKVFAPFHDELATMVKTAWDAPGLLDLLWCMSQPPKWAPDMILGAAGWEGTYYHKE